MKKMHSSFQKRNVMPREKYHVTIKLNQYTNIAAIKYLQCNIIVPSRFRKRYRGELPNAILSLKSHINFFHIAK